MQNDKLASALNVSDSEIEATYASLNKTSEERRHINCKLCGFDTCEQLMVAILLGMKSVEDCDQYRKEAMQEAKLQNVVVSAHGITDLCKQLETCIQRQSESLQRLCEDVLELKERAAQLGSLGVAENEENGEG